MKNLVPLWFDLHERHILVVGAGPVGCRRVQNLVNSQAKIRWVACDPPSDVKWCEHPQLDWHQTAYHVDHLTNMQFVFAAVNPSVDAQILADCRERGIFCNVADVLESGDFQLSSVLTRGHLQIAISTAGVAPYLAKELKGKFETDFSADWAQWLNQLAEYRMYLQANIPDDKIRQELMRQASALAKKPLA